MFSPFAPGKMLLSRFACGSGPALGVFSGVCSALNVPSSIALSTGSCIFFATVNPPRYESCDTAVQTPSDHLALEHRKPCPAAHSLGGRKGRIQDHSPDSAIPL